jgi:hypothetical protein
MSLAETVAALKVEPLWAASSGARELFHSDLLQWLAEQEPQTFAKVFGLDPSTAYRCDRERGHLDLRLIPEGKGRALAVENKLFSPPNEDQLQRYEVTFLNRPQMTGCRQTLLSLTDPGWPDNRYGRWSWMSYGTLGDHLVETFSERDDFAGQFACHWGRLCLLLDELRSVVSIDDEDEPYRLSDEVAEHLDKRLRAFADTLRAYQLHGRIRARLVDAENVDVAVSFTRGTALVQAFSEGPNGDLLGWQLQGRQWRLAAMVPQDRQYGGRMCWGRDSDAGEARTLYLAEHYPDHFRFDELDAAGIEAVPAATQKAFQQFAPRFTYQYRNVLGPTVRQLTDVAEATSRRVIRAFGEQRS